jgi:uncharacterized membrane protein YphA (DoxX/SURF4 family)
MPGRSLAPPTPRDAKLGAAQLSPNIPPSQSLSRPAMPEGLDWGLADGARWVLAVVFCLSGIEKASTLSSHAARWHPVMLVSGWRRKHATALLAASLITDLLCIVFLVAGPRIGSFLALGLLVAYTLAGFSVHEHADADCQCLFGILKTRTRETFLVRNAALLILAALSGSASTPRWRGALVGAALLLLLMGLLKLTEGVVTRRSSILSDSSPTREGV